MNKEDILKKLREAYDSFSEEFSQTRKGKIWPEVVSFLEISKGTILDLGCGYNKYGEYAKGIHICFDFSKNLIKLSRLDISESFYVVGDITASPFKDKSADYVICIATLHHIPGREKRRRVLKELIRLAKKGVLISVWYYYQKRFIGKKKDLDVGWRGKYFRYYHLYDFKELVEDSLDIDADWLLAFIDYNKRNIYLEIKA